MSLQPSPTVFFSGEYSHGMDGKGRLTIPSQWRRGEADEFIFFPDSGNQWLRAMRPEEFAKAAEKAPDGAVTQESKTEFQRWFCSRAQQVTVDKQGRLVLPETLRKFLAVGDVVLVGTFNAFEVWNKEHYEKTKAEREALYQKEARLRGL